MQVLHMLTDKPMEAFHSPNLKILKNLKNLLAFFCLLHKSNYVPISVKKFDKTRQLCCGDIAVGTDLFVGQH